MLRSARFFLHLPDGVRRPRENCKNRACACAQCSNGVAQSTRDMANRKYILEPFAAIEVVQFFFLLVVVVGGGAKIMRHVFGHVSHLVTIIKCEYFCDPQ